MLIFKNTIYQLIAKTISAFISLFITILIVSHFGINGYGDFIKITSFVGLFYLLTDFGLNAIFLQKERNALRFQDILHVRILIAFGLILFAILVSFFLPYNKELSLGFSFNDRFGILIYSFTILTQAISFSSAAIFQKRHRYDLFMLASIIASAVTVLSVFVVVKAALPLWYVLFSFVLGGIVGAIVALMWTKEKILPFSLPHKATREVIRESFPIGMMIVFSFIYFRIDIFLLSLFRPVTEVGVYGVAGKFFEFLIALPLFLSNALYPTLVEEQKNKRNGTRTRILKRYLLISFVSSLILVIVFWFASPLLSLIKEEFTFSIIPFRILLFSLPFFFATSLLQWFLIAHRKQKFLLFVYCIGAILNIVLNILFIPSYSYMASAVITGVCEGFILLALAYQVFIKKLHES